jgi:S1-C subfamily serine protease
VALSGQATSALRITVTLRGADQAITPIARHVLFISDNPATVEPRRVLTGPDGTAVVRLPPGNYTVESDRPVRFLGRAYQWTEMLDIVAGRDVTLDLTAENAEVVPLDSTDTAPAAGSSPGDPTVDLRKWYGSLVGVWSPTARLTGFLVDSRGLIATDARGIRSAAVVEVQVSADLKVAGRVLVAEAARGVAVVHVDPATLEGRTPVTLPCAPVKAPPLDEGQLITALTLPLRRGADEVSGEVITLKPRAVEVDLRLAFGGAGGPAFNAAGDVVGLTALPEDERRRVRDAEVVRVGVVCETLMAVRDRLPATPPEATPLPGEPARSTVPPPPPPTKTSRAAPSPPVVSSDDFEVAFLTPAIVEGALQKADWTGGAGGRTPDAEARLGRLTDFGPWSEYFADNPPVVVVRVSPKLVEGFWRRLAREAARTQGAELPPLKAFAANFLRLQASCGGEPIRPIHPFVIEHRASDAVVREGLYVFDPDALTSCASLTLALYSEKEPQRPSTVAVPAAVVDRIRQGY